VVLKAAAAAGELDQQFEDLSDPKRSLPSSSRDSQTVMGRVRSLIAAWNFPARV
jgi:hypothetical protein